MPTPVRVCFVIDKLSRAGTEMQLLALIRELDRTRVRPSLVLLNAADDAESAALEPSDCPTLRLRLSSLRRPAALADLARFGWFLQTQRPDVVQTYFLDSTYIGLPFARLMGVRKLVRVRNNAGYWLNPLHKGLGRVMSRLADVTLTNCVPAQQELHRVERGPRHKVRVLENGVDLDCFVPLPTPDTGRASVVRIGTVANLRPVKNLDLLIDAAAQVVRLHPRAEFELAGEGDDRPRLEAKIADHGLQGRVRLVGGVADVPHFLRRLDVAVLCSQSEGLSNALLEYMAAGRAIVSTRVGACARLIDDGVQGLLIPPGQVEPLVAALDRLLREPHFARQLALAARQRAEVEFSRAAMRRRFEDFYHELAAA